MIDLVGSPDLQNIRLVCPSDLMGHSVGGVTEGVAVAVGAEEQAVLLEFITCPDGQQKPYSPPCVLHLSLPVGVVWPWS